MPAAARTSTEVWMMQHYFGHVLVRSFPVLMKAEEVKRNMAGRFAWWSGLHFPRGLQSENIWIRRFKLILDNENREITEMDESQAYHELHPGKQIYMHDGALYEVLKLDLVSRTATAKSFEGELLYSPAGTEDIRILQTFQEKQWKERRYISEILM